MKRIKIVFEMLHKLNVILPDNCKKKIPLMFFSIIIASTLEMLGIAIIVPFMNLLTDSEGFSNKWYVVLLSKVFGVEGFFGQLLLIGIIVLLVYVVKNIILLWSRQYQNKFQCGVQSTLSTEMLKACTERPYTYFTNVNSAEMLTNIFSDVNNVYTTIGNFLAIISESITLLMIGVFIFATDWVMALGIIALAGVCVLGIVFGFRKISTKSGEQYRDSYNEMYKNAMQTIDGIKEIKIARCSTFFVELFDKSRKKFRDAQITGNFINLCPERIVETLFIGGIIMVLVFRIRWGMDVNESIVTLSAFAMAGYRLLPSVNKLSANMNSLIYYQPSVDAIYDNHLDDCRYQKEKEYYQKEHCTTENEVVKKSFDSNIEIRDVSFSYENSKKNIIEKLNLVIEKGKSIALIGESGAGKSTLSNILLGLYMPTDGSVYMDGIDVYTIPDKWSRMIGYVPQSVFLLDASIRENIAFGLEEMNISDDMVWKALQNAQLDEFVKCLPDGLDTIVGEQGVRLSGGQRQRIAIARALYHDPDILILDEATSALDNDTEKAVMEAIDGLHGKKTLIIVAHRLSTIKNCDEIYEIRDGKAMQRDKTEVLKAL